MNDDLHTVYTVRRVVPEGAAGVTLILDSPLPTAPGQFVMVWLPGVEERPFSVMDDAPLSVTVADVGPFTHALCALQAGDRVWVRGPYGHGYSQPTGEFLLVGGGSGAASLTLLAARAIAAGRRVVAAIGARTADDLLLAWRFRQLGCELIVATDDGTAGCHGTVLDAIGDRLAMPSSPAAPTSRDRPDSVYACGPEGMLVALARLAEAQGVPCEVSMERTMKCGIGLSGACHCGDRLVCQDGPVFAGQTILRALG